MKAVYLAKIVKIEFKYNKSLNYTSLIKKAEKCFELIKSINKRNIEFLKQYTELTQILEELKQKEINSKNEGVINEEKKHIIKLKILLMKQI